MSTVDARVSPGVMAKAVEVLQRDLDSHTADPAGRHVLTSTVRQISNYLEGLGVPRPDCTMHAGRIAAFVELRADRADAPDLWMNFVG